jgi:predicted methyltransferase
MGHNPTGYRTYQNCIAQDNKETVIKQYKVTIYKVRQGIYNIKNANTSTLMIVTDHYFKVVNYIIKHNLKLFP